MGKLIEKERVCEKFRGICWYVEVGKFGIEKWVWVFEKNCNRFYWWGRVFKGCIC